MESEAEDLTDVDSVDREDAYVPPQPSSYAYNGEKPSASKLLSLSFLEIGLLVIFNFASIFLHHYFPLLTFAALLVCMNTGVLQLLLLNPKSSSSAAATKGLTVSTRDDFQPRAKPFRSTDAFPVSSTAAKQLGLGPKRATIKPTQGSGEKLASGRRSVTISAEKILPGKTLVYMSTEGKTALTEEEGERLAKFGEWSRIDASSFIVRQGPDYSVNKMKAPSEECLYETVCIDIYSSKNKLKHVARYFDLSALETPHAGSASVVSGSSTISPQSPASAGSSGALKVEVKDEMEMKEGFPKYVVVHIVCPLYAPGVLSQVTDGEGFSMIVFLRLTEKTKNVLKTGTKTPAMELFQKFVESEDDIKMRSRFKCIPKALNPDECNLGRVLKSLMDSYNSTPFLTAAGQHVEYYSGKDYFEIDIDIHRFSSLARNGFFHLKHIFQSIKADFSFLIEGRTNDELPEQLLGGFRVYQVNVNNARPFPFES